MSDAPQKSADADKKGRPFLSVQFACCSVYQRIYRSADGKSYNGRCPRCGKPVKFTVGEGGTDSRAFIVY
jgi:PHP family Zn ribbon phosphoesterase